MQKISLDALAREQLEQARGGNGRSAATIVGGHEHVLRQTVMALTAGTSTGEHSSPGEATVHVLLGRVELTAGKDTWTGKSGDLLIIPPTRHALTATEDAAVVLTVAKSVRET